MQCLENFIQSMRCKRAIKWILFYWIIGVVIYLSTITDCLPNPDAIWNGVYYKNSFKWEMGLGRWGIKYIQDLREGVINPSFITAMGLLYLGCIAYIVTQIFGMETIIGRICVGALIVCTPNVVSALTYYYCSDMYFFSYLLAVVAVWHMSRAKWNRRGICHAIAASLCLLLSIGIYQAYVSLAILLCAIYLLIMLVRDEKLIEVVKKGIIMLASGAGGILAYLLTTKYMQAITQVTAVEDRGFATMGKISIADLKNGIVNAYLYFFKYFLRDTLINNSWGNRKEINVIFFMVLFCVGVYCVVKMNTSWICKVMAIVLACLLPICFMNILILAPKVGIEQSTGILMLPGMNYIYVLLLLLGEKLKAPIWMKRISSYSIFIITMLVLNMLLVLNLSAQTYMQYNMRKTYYVASEMVSEIEQLGINTDEYQLCILGTMENGKFPDNQGELGASVKWLTASYGMMWSDDNGRNSCWKFFMEQFVGKSYARCGGETTAMLRELPEVKEMGVFPGENSIKVIDDVIVIKLSE